MTNTCQLCPLSECHGYDEEQIRRVVVKRDTSIKCPVILSRILEIETIVEWWSGKVMQHVMAIKWMERYCNQMISRIEWSKQNEKKSKVSSLNHHNGDGHTRV